MDELKGREPMPLTSPMKPADLPVDRIAELCRAFAVARLDVFGSAVTDLFDPTRSDVDFLVEFRPDVADAFLAYFGFKDALEALLERPVDLVSPRALRNPYFAEAVAETRHELFRESYAA